MSNDAPNLATGCPPRQPIDPGKPSPDWFVGCWNVRVGRPAPQIKIEKRIDGRLTLSIWRTDNWQPADVLEWNLRTYTLDSRLRCISYWRRGEQVRGAKDSIFAYLRDPDGSAKLLPFEEQLTDVIEAEKLFNTDVAWGAEEEGG